MNKPESRFRINVEYAYLIRNTVGLSIHLKSENKRTLNDSNTFLTLSIYSLSSTLTAKSLVALTDLSLAAVC